MSEQLEQVVIIGDSGSAPNTRGLLTSDLWMKTCDRVVQEMDAVLPIMARELVSNGEAWMSHIPVALFLRGEARNLSIAAPCPWDGAQLRYVAGRSSQKAARMNHDHQLFTDVMKVSSFLSLQRAVKHPRSRFNVHPSVNGRERVLSRGYLLIVIRAEAGDAPAVWTPERYVWDRFDGPHRVYLSFAESAK